MSEADFLIQLKKELKLSRDVTDRIISLIDKRLKANNQLDMFSEIEDEYSTIESKVNKILGDVTFKNSKEYNIPPKTDRIQWKDYFYLVIKEIGGKVKTGEIANAVIKVNRNYTYNRIRQEAATKLPLLVKENRLKVTLGVTKKDGNTYEVLS